MRTEATAIIGNVQAQCSGLGKVQSHQAGVCVRMTLDIGQGFQDDAIRGDLDRGGQWRHRFGRFNHYAQPIGLSRVPRVFAQCRDEAKFIQHRWAQRIDDTANFGKRRLDLPFEGIQQQNGGVKPTVVAKL